MNEKKIMITIIKTNEIKKKLHLFMLLLKVTFYFFFPDHGLWWL